MVDGSGGSLHGMVSVISSSSRRCLVVVRLLGLLLLHVLVMLLGLVLHLLVMHLLLLLLLLLGVQLRMGGHLGKSLGQSLGHGGRRGQMIADGTEAVLVRNVVHSDLVAVLVGVRVGSLGHLNLVLLLARVLHVSVLLLVDAVGRLELVLVGAVLVLVRLALDDRDVLARLLLLHLVLVLVVLLLLGCRLMMVLRLLFHHRVQGLMLLLVLMLRLVVVRVFHFGRVVLGLRVIIHFGGGGHNDHGQECNELEGGRNRQSR